MRKSILSKAAALMGRVKSEKKAAAARRNGKLGGAGKHKEHRGMTPFPRRIMPKGPPAARSERPQRRRTALAMRIAGETYQAIADSMGVSRQRVQQLIAPPKSVRDAVMARAGGHCERCGNRVRSLHVHHRRHYGVDAEVYESLNNLTAVCVRCHRFIHHGK